MVVEGGFQLQARVITLLSSFQRSKIPVFSIKLLIMNTNINVVIRDL